MPDISMCLDSKCPARQGCHRYLARPTPGRQSYADFAWSDEGCSEFWETNIRDRSPQEADEANAKDTPDA